MQDSVKVGQTSTAVIDFTGWAGKTVGDGLSAMTAGNADSSDQAIFASDLALIHAHMPMLTVPYLNSDVNLDGNIDLFDYDLCKTNMLAGLYSKVKE